MMRNHEKTYVCAICQQQKPARESLHGDLVHSPVVEMIRRTHPGWSSQDVICLSCLNRFRADCVERVVEAEKGELSSLEAEVVRSLKEYELISEDLNVQFDRRLTWPSASRTRSLS